MPRARALAAACLSALAVLPGAAPAPAAPAEGTVLNAGAPDAVPGRYIVLMNPAVPGVSAQSLAGDTLIRRFAAINGFAATMTGRAARRLAADPRVRLVEQSRRVRVEAVQRNPVWGLDRIDQRGVRGSRSYDPTDDGDTVHAYVIDTGIRLANTQFGGRATYGYDFVDHDRFADDCNGHGTHVAGTIGGATYGVAKKVHLVAVRVLDCTGEGYTDDVIDGVNWVTENAELPAVANMSVGGPGDRAVDEAVRQSIAAGVTYAVAAGNSGDDAKYYSPARVAAAITVGATDSTDRRASFSNYGSTVDIWAPGVGITSAWIGAKTATKVLSGTSMATPHVAGAAALILDEFPSYTPAQVRDRLVRTATTVKAGRLLYVPAPPAATTITTGSLPVAGAGEPYRAQLAVASPRTGRFSLSGGTLPPGLKLSPGGLLTGTPAAAGTFEVTVRFTDFVPRSTTRALTLTIDQAAGDTP